MSLFFCPHVNKETQMYGIYANRKSTFFTTMQDHSNEMLLNTTNSTVQSGTEPGGIHPEAVFILILFLCICVIIPITSACVNCWRRRNPVSSDTTSSLSISGTAVSVVSSSSQYAWGDTSASPRFGGSLATSSRTEISIEVEEVHDEDGGVMK